jgi:hypothetical protein
MQNESPKWKQFEKKAFEIQKSLSPANADVRYNDSIFGSDSKTDRQIDISIRSRVGSYSILIVVECKDHKTPVDVTDVEGFITKLRDVRANKGVMISAKGFTKAATTLAEHHEVDLRRLIDTESVEWGDNVYVPCLLERTYMASCNLEVHDFFELPLQSQKLFALELKTESGERIGTSQDVLHRKWDSHEVPHSPGTYKVTIGTKLITEFNGVAQSGSIYAHVVVEHAFYSGFVPIHFQGFINVKSGGLITRQILTGVISPIAIEKGEILGWKQINNPSELSPSPAFTIGYFDVYFPHNKQAGWPTSDL